MVPFIVAKNHEVLNLAAIERVVEVAGDAGGIIVCLVSGERLSYHGQAAELIKAACMTHLKIFHEALAASQQTIIHPGEVMRPIG